MYINTPMRDQVRIAKSGLGGGQKVNSKIHKSAQYLIHHYVHENDKSQYQSALREIT